MQRPGLGATSDRDSPRRRFMKAAMYAPAVVIAATRPEAAVTTEPQRSTPDPSASGYRETDHIRRYYATAQY
jgi:hypothetical protein